MAHHDHLDRQHKVLHYLSQLPRKIVSLHGTENLTEFVLHDLCDERCFNLKKAAYFVNNPDFNCLKGVAGFHCDECFSAGSLWDCPHDFSAHMKESGFNQKVRSIDQCSIARDQSGMQGLVKDIAHELGMHDYCVQTWDLKHDNHGVLLFEKADATDNVSDELIESGACLLGFCPVF